MNSKLRKHSFYQRNNKQLLQTLKNFLFDDYSFTKRAIFLNGNK